MAKELVELERWQVEGVYDNAIDDVNDAWMSELTDKPVMPSEILKKCRPEQYEEGLRNYCEAEEIFIVTDDEGNESYFEVKED